MYIKIEKQLFREKSTPDTPQNGRHDIFMSMWRMQALKLIKWKNVNTCIIKEENQ